MVLNQTIPFSGMTHLTSPLMKLFPNKHVTFLYWHINEELLHEENGEFCILDGR